MKPNYFIRTAIYESIEKATPIRLPNFSNITYFRYSAKVKTNINIICNDL